MSRPHRHQTEVKTPEHITLCHKSFTTLVYFQVGLTVMGCMHFACVRTHCRLQQPMVGGGSDRSAPQHLRLFWFCSTPRP
eukprot:2350010-Amphidinium_carterae.2